MFENTVQSSRTAALTTKGGARRVALGAITLALGAALTTGVAAPQAQAKSASSQLSVSDRWCC